MYTKSLKFKLLLISFLFFFASSSSGALRELSELCFHLFPECAKAKKTPYTKDFKSVFKFKKHKTALQKSLKKYNDFVKKELLKSKNWLDQKTTPKKTLFVLPKTETEEHLKDLVENTDPLPYLQKVTLQPSSEVFFMGDIHGSIHSLLRNLWRLVQLGRLGEDFKIKKENFYMIFLGDYVGGGRNSCEVLYTLLELANNNPGKVFLLKGNHDYVKQSINNGFLGLFNPSNKKDPKYAQKNDTYTTRFEDGEVSNKFGTFYDPEVSDLLAHLASFFNTLPLALVLEVETKKEETETITSFSTGSAAEEKQEDTVTVKKRNRILCCHGGISKQPTIHDMLNFFNSDKKFLKIELDREQSNDKYSGFAWSEFIQCTPTSASASQNDMSAFDWENIGASEYGPGWQATEFYTQKYLAQRGLQAFIHGHQDRAFGFKMLFAFDKIKNDIKKLEATKAKDLKKLQEIKEFKTNFYPNGPFYWKHVLSEKGLEHNKTHGFLMKAYAPIFAFSSAPEGRGQYGITVDCFGIMKLEENYGKCRLKIYEFELDLNRDRKYVSLKPPQTEEDLFTITWLDQQPESEEKVITISEPSQAEKPGFFQKAKTFLGLDKEKKKE